MKRFKFLKYALGVFAAATVLVVCINFGAQSGQDTGDFFIQTESTTAAVPDQNSASVPPGQDAAETQEKTFLEKVGAKINALVSNGQNLQEEKKVTTEDEKVVSDPADKDRKDPVKVGDDPEPTPIADEEQFADFLADATTGAQVGVIKDNLDLSKESAGKIYTSVGTKTLKLQADDPTTEVVLTIGNNVIEVYSGSLAIVGGKITGHSSTPPNLFTAFNSKPTKSPYENFEEPEWADANTAEDEADNDKPKLMASNASNASSSMADGTIIHNKAGATLSIKDTTFDKNNMTYGCVYNNGILNLDSCTFTGNESTFNQQKSPWGGTCFFNSGKATAKSSYFGKEGASNAENGNISKSCGGAIFNINNLTLENCKVTNNHADYLGGGVFNMLGAKFSLKGASTYIYGNTDGVDNKQSNISIAEGDKITADSLEDCDACSIGVTLEYPAVGKEFLDMSTPKDLHTKFLSDDAAYEVQYDSNKHQLAEATSRPITIIQPSEGSISVKPANAKPGEKVTLTVDPKGGYELDQWGVTAPQNLTIDDDGTFIMPADEVKIAPIMKKISYKVEYLAGRTTSGVTPTGEPPKDESTYSYGEPVTVMDSNFKVTTPGSIWNFAGWKDNNENSYNPNDTFTIEGDMTLIEKDGVKYIQLTAQWSNEPTYKVTYNKGSVADGTTITGTVPTDANSYRYKANMQLKTQEDLACNKYTFMGWQYNGVTYKAGETIAFPDTADIELVASWERESYPINYLEKNAEGKWVPFTGNHIEPHPEKHTYGVKTFISDANKDGYEFGGWFLDKDFQTKVAEIAPDKDYDPGTVINLYADLNIKTYTITYLDELGAEYSGYNKAELPPTHTYGTKTTLKDGVKLRNTFKGWFTDRECTPGEETGPFTTLEATKYTDDITLYAKWEETSYTVHYKTYTAEIKDKTNLKWESTNLLPPDELSRPGCYFSGWFADEELKIPVTNDTTYGQIAGEDKAEITLYAGWQGKTGYVLNYDPDGGDLNVDKKEGLNWIQDHLLPDDYPRLQGYKFDGWYTERKGAGDPVTAKTIYGDIAKTEAGSKNATIYANWTERTGFTVTYNTDGGSSVADLTNQNWTSTGLLPASEPTKVGYKFGGWFSNPEKTEEVTDETKYADIAKTDDVNTITLYAKWDAPIYNITYKDQGGDDFSGTHEADYPTKHSYGTDTILKTATKPHYTFEGWFDNSECIGERKTIIPAEYSKNITLYAKWKPDVYEIMYFDQGGNKFTGEWDGDHPDYHTYGTDTRLVEPKKDGGWSFAGWYTDSECETGRVKTLGAEEYTADIPLYAKWVETSYYVKASVDSQSSELGTVTLQDGSGELKEIVENIPYGASIEYSPESDGLQKITIFNNTTTYATITATPGSSAVFNKWSTNATSLNSNIKFLASFSAVFTVTADVSEETKDFGSVKILKDGVEVDELTGIPSGTKFSPSIDEDTGIATVTIGEEPNVYGEIIATPNPKDPRYFFKEWKTTPSTSEIISADTKFTATFVSKNKITFDVNGGTGGNVDWYVDSTFIVPDPKSLDIQPPDNHMFTSWNTSGDGTGTTYVVGQEVEKVTADMTLYAQWDISSDLYYAEFTNTGSSGGTPPEKIYANKSDRDTWLMAPYPNELKPPEGQQFYRWLLLDKNGKIWYDKYGDPYLPVDAGDPMPIAIWMENLHADGYNLDYVKFQPEWESPSYKLNFSANGGSGTAPEPQFGFSGEDKVLMPYPDNLIPPSEDLKFHFWQQAGRPYTYAPGKVYTFSDFISGGGEATLDAIWEKPYTFSYDAAGADGKLPDSFDFWKDEASKVSYTMPYPENLAHPDSAAQFLGWNTEPDYSGISFDANYTLLESDIKNLINKYPDGVKFYAKWNLSYTITYNQGEAISGKAPTAETVRMNGSFTAKVNEGSLVGPDNTDFLFWNTKKDYTGRTIVPESTYEISKLIALGYPDGLDLYPQFDKTYNVNYNVSGGSGDVPEPQSGKYDGNIKLPEKGDLTPPVGYEDEITEWYVKYNGWDSSKSKEWKIGEPGDTVDLSTLIDAGVKTPATLYAKWKPQNFDITYRDQYDKKFSGDWKDDDHHPTVHVYGTDTVLISPVKTGYDLEGWYLNPDCTGEPITTLGANDFTGDITLYAKWKPKTFTVTYTANGGQGWEKQDGKLTIEVQYPSFIVIDPGQYGLTAPSNQGFSNWKMTYPYTVELNAGAEVNLLEYLSYGNTIALKANWTTSSLYTVKYSSNGSSGGNPPKDVKGYKDAPFFPADPVDLIPPEGKKFHYWYAWDVKDEEEVPITPGECTYQALYELNGNKSPITIYPKWDPVVTVKYDANGGTGTPPEETYGFIGDSKKIELPYADNLQGPYDKPFKYWSTSKFVATGEKIYPPGYETTVEKLINLDPLISQVTLYAIWDNLPHTASFDLNEGSGTTPEPISFTNWDYPITLPSGDGITGPHGENFVGWSISGDQKIEDLYQAGQEVYVFKDIEFKAMFGEKVTITFYDKDETELTSETKVWSEQIKLPTEDDVTLNPPTGYKFSFWNTQQDGSGTDFNPGESYPISKFIETKTLYAKYTPIFYDVYADKASGANGTVTLYDGYNNVVKRISVPYDCPIQCKGYPNPYKQYDGKGRAEVWFSDDLACYGHITITPSDPSGTAPTLKQAFVQKCQINGADKEIPDTFTMEIIKDEKSEFKFVMPKPDTSRYDEVRVNNSSMGSVDAYGLRKKGGNVYRYYFAYGMTYTVKGNVITFGSDTQGYYGQFTAKANDPGSGPTTNKFVKWQILSNVITEDLKDGTYTWTANDNQDILIAIFDSGATRTNTVTPKVASGQEKWGEITPAEATSGIPYEAQITASGNKVTIKSKDGKSVLKTYTATPKPSDEPGVSYEFDKWTGIPDSGKITANFVLTANFKKIYNKNVTASVAEGQSEWGKVKITDASGAEVDKLTAPVNSTVEYSDDKKTATITDPDERLCGTITAIPSETTQDATYVFDKWTTEHGSITEDVTFEANFKKINLYTVNATVNDQRWGSVKPKELKGVPAQTKVTVNKDTISLSDETTGYEATITATAKSSTDEWAFYFDGWDGEVPETITDNTEIKANFAQVDVYTITAKVAEGCEAYGTVEPTQLTQVPKDTVITYEDDNKTVKFTHDKTGFSATIKAIPIVDIDYVNTFTEWTNAPTEVTSDMTFEAKFTQADRICQVTVPVSFEGGRTVLTIAGEEQELPATVDVKPRTQVTYSNREIKFKNKENQDCIITAYAADAVKQTHRYVGYVFNKWAATPSTITEDTTTFTPIFTKCDSMLQVTAKINIKDTGKNGNIVSTFGSTIDEENLFYGWVPEYSLISSKGGVNNHDTIMFRDADTGTVYGQFSFISDENPNWQWYVWYWDGYSEGDIVDTNKDFAANVSEQGKGYTATGSIDSGQSGIGEIKYFDNGQPRKSTEWPSFHYKDSIASNGNVIKIANRYTIQADVLATQTPAPEPGYKWVFDKWLAKIEGGEPTDQLPEKLLTNTEFIASFKQAEVTYHVDFDIDDDYPVSVHEDSPDGKAVTEIEVPQGTGDVIVTAESEEITFAYNIDGEDKTQKFVLVNTDEDNCTFNGWNFNPALSAGNKLTSDTVITPDLSFNVYEIALSQSYEGRVPDFPGLEKMYEKIYNGFYKDEACTQQITSVKVPMIRGMEFDKYVDGDNNEIIDSGGDIKVKASHFTDDAELDAKYDPAEFTFTLKYNAGEGVGSKFSDTVTEQAFEHTFTVKAVGDDDDQLNYVYPGYEFVNWKYIDGTEEKTIDPDETITLTTSTPEIELTACWKQTDVPVKLAYNIADGQSDMGTINSSEEDILPSAETAVGSEATPNPGYKFKEWKIEKVSAESETVSTNETLTPKTYNDNGSTIWTARKYIAYFELDWNQFTLEYNANKGDSPEEVRQDKATVQALSHEFDVKAANYWGFTRQGYKLTGWAYDAAGTQPVDPEETITVAVTDDKNTKTIYAMWEEEVGVTLNYQAQNGGSVSREIDSDIKPVSGKVNEVTATANPSYQFDHWECNGVAIPKDQTPEGKLTPQKGDVPGSQIWTERYYVAYFTMTSTTYTITYKDDDKEIKDEVKEASLSHVFNVKDSSTFTAKVGYTFDYWVDANKGDEKYYPGNSITLDTDNKEKTLVAKWREKPKVKISYISADESFGKVSSESEMIAQDPTATPEGSEAQPQPGYKLASWTCDGYEIPTTDAKLVPNVKDGDDYATEWSKRTYVAHFEVANNTFTLNYGGTEIPDEKWTGTVLSHDFTITETLPQPATGQAFKYWKYFDGEEEKTINPGDTITVNATDTNMTKTLIPIWEGATYTVTIDGVGLNERPEKRTGIPHGATYSITSENKLEIAYPSGFKEYYIPEPDAAHKGNATWEPTSGTITENTTIYANFEARDGCVAKAVVYGTATNDDFNDNLMEFVYDDIDYNDQYMQDHGIRRVFPVNWSSRGNPENVEWITINKEGDDPSKWTGTALTQPKKVNFASSFKYAIPANASESKHEELTSLSRYFAFMTNFQSTDEESCITGFENIPDSVTDAYMMFYKCSASSNKSANIDFSNFNSTSIDDAEAFFQNVDTDEGFGGTLTFSGDTLPNAKNLDHLGQGRFSKYQFKIGENGNKYGWKKTDFSTLLSGARMTSFDLTSLDLSNAENTESFFYNCPNLQTIYSNAETDANLKKVTKSDMMFATCPKLKGQNGTTSDDLRRATRDADRPYKVEFARIDNWNGETQPSYPVDEMGYFTDINNMNEHLIEIDNSQSTIATVDSDFRTANVGTTVTLTVTFKTTGRVLNKFDTTPDSLEIKPSSNKHNTYTFVMPNEDVSIKPNYVQADGKAIVFEQNDEDTYMEFICDSPEAISKKFVKGQPAQDPKYSSYGIVKELYDIPYIAINPTTGQPTDLPKWTTYDKNTGVVISKENPKQINFDYSFANCDGSYTKNGSWKPFTSMAWFFAGMSNFASDDNIITGLNNIPDTVTDLSYMLYKTSSDASSIANLDMSGYRLSKITAVNKMLDGSNLSGKLKFSSVTLSAINNFESQGSPFEGSNFQNYEFEKAGTNYGSGITNFKNMFSGCSNIGSLDLSNVDFRNATSLEGLFENCSALNSVTFDSYKHNTEVTNLKHMFYNCQALKVINITFIKDTSNITDTTEMFFGDVSLNRVHVDSKWDLANVPEGKSSNMFGSMPNVDRCDNLVGKNGTKYANVTERYGSAPTDKTLAKVDKWDGSDPDSCGLFWDRTEPDVSFLSFMPDSHSQFTTMDVKPLSWVEVEPAGDYEFKVNAITDGYVVNYVKANGTIYEPDSDGRIIIKNITENIYVQAHSSEKTLDYYSLEELQKISDDIAQKGDKSSYYKEFKAYMEKDSIWYSQSKGVYDPSVDALNKPTENMKQYACSFITKADGTPDTSNINNYLFLRIIGINHDYIAGSSPSRAGLTFQAVHALPQAYAGSADTVWSTSALRAAMQDGGEIYSKLNHNFRSSIIPVDKYSTSKHTLDTYLETTQDKLFLTSYSEMSQWGKKYEFSDWNDNGWNGDKQIFEPGIKAATEGYAYDWYRHNSIKGTCGNSDLTNLYTCNDGNVPANSSYNGAWERSGFELGNNQISNWKPGVITSTGCLFDLSVPTSLTCSVVPSFCLGSSTNGSSTATLSYSSNGANSGNSPAANKVKTCETVKVPSAGSLSYSSKQFKCWNTKADGTGKDYYPADSYIVSENSTLYAKWDNRTTTVTLDPNGGDGTTDEVTATYGNPMPDFFSKKPTKEHYTFDGYYDAKVGGKQYYNMYGSSKNEWDKDVDTYTLYAHWKPLEYQIFLYFKNDTTNFNWTWGDYGEIMPNIDDASTGSSSSLIPTRKDYVFEGYFDQEVGGTQYYDSTGKGCHIFDKVDGKGKAIALYAHWGDGEKTHVNLNANGGQYGTVTDIHCTLGEWAPDISTIPGWAPVWEGHKFLGYFGPNDKGSEVLYITETGQPNYGVVWNVETTEAVTFYAKWQAIETNVYLRAQGGSGGQSYTTVTYGMPLPNINSRPTRVGYDFDGYFDSNGKQYYNSTGKPTVEAWDIDPKDQVYAELYAHWKPKVTKATFDNTEGTGTVENVLATTGEDMPTLSAIPTRTGYDFDGYYDGTSLTAFKYYKADGTSARKWDKGADTTLYAKWNPKTLEVRLNANGGVEGSKNSVNATFTKAMPTINPLDLPTKAGYVFDGFYDKVDDDDATQYYNADGTSAREWDKDDGSAAYTLYAHWDTIHSDITLDVNGGNAIALNTLTAVYNEPMPALEDEQKQPTWPLPAEDPGYCEFDGYFDNPTSGTMYYDASGEPATDVVWDKTTTTATLYAHWHFVKTKVTFKDNGGSGGPQGSIEAEFGEKMRDLDPYTEIPKYVGHRFIGYYDQHDVVMYFDGEGKCVNPWAVNAQEYSLVALWAEKDATHIALESNDGEGETQYVDALLSGNLPQLDSSSLPKRIGYTFKGYFDNPTEGEKYYDETGTGLKQWDKDVPNASLYAHWEPVKTTVKLNPNGGAGGDASLTATYDKKLPDLIEGVPSKDHHIFKGYWSPDFTTQYIDDEGKATAQIWKNPVSETTLQALWEAETYTVTFDLRMGKVEPYSQTFYYGQAQNLESLKVFKEHGWTFEHWFVKDHDDITYRDGERVIDIAGDNDNVELIAKWTPNKYDVHFDGNLATSGSPQTIPCEYDTIFSIPKTDFIKEGCTLKGWAYDPKATEPDFEPEQTDIQNLTEENHATVWLYAVWAPTEVTISFNDGSTTPPDSITRTYGSPYGDLPVAEAPDDTTDFYGWYLDPDRTQKVEKTTLVTKGNNHTLYAKFGAKLTTIEFVTYSNNPNPPAPIKVVPGTSINLLDGSQFEYTRTIGKKDVKEKFHHWDMSPDGTSEKIYYSNQNFEVKGTDAGKKITFYAAYEDNVAFSSFKKDGYQYVPIFKTMYSGDNVRFYYKTQNGLRKMIDLKDGKYNFEDVLEKFKPQGDATELTELYYCDFNLNRTSPFYAIRFKNNVVPNMACYGDEESGSVDEVTKYMGWKSGELEDELKNGEYWSGLNWTESNKDKQRFYWNDKNDKQGSRYVDYNLSVADVITAINNCGLSRWFPNSCWLGTTPTENGFGSWCYEKNQISGALEVNYKISTNRWKPRTLIICRKFNS